MVKVPPLTKASASGYLLWRLMRENVNHHLHKGTDARRFRAGEAVAKVCQVMMSLAPGEEKHLGRVVAAPLRCMAPLAGEVIAISVLKDLFW